MNSPHDPFETRLRRRLQSTSIDLPAPAGPTAAADRAAQRSRRRRTAMASVAAVAVLGGLSPLVLGNDGDDGVTTEYAAPIDAHGVELDWQVHDDGLAQTGFGPGTGGGSDFYALSTAPSTKRIENPDTFTARRAVYRLGDDGWVPIELGDDDPKIARLSERNGTLYGLSTAADTGAPIGSFSTDGGQSWSQVALDDIAPPSDAVDWEMGVAVELASTADATVAVVNVAFRPPAEDLFPELNQDTENGAFHYSQAGEAGLELVKVTTSGDSAGAAGVSTTAPPESVATVGTDPLADEDMNFGDPSAGDVEEVVRTIPWSELGVSGPQELSSTTTYQAEGGAWTPIAGGPERNGGIIDFTSSDDAVLMTTASATSPVGAEVYYTTDGTQWQEVSTPGDTSSSNGRPSMGVAPGGALLQVTAQNENADLTVGDIVAQVSNDLGASWSEIDLASLVPDIADLKHPTTSVSSGPLGVAVRIQAFAGEPGDEDSDRSDFLLFSTDLRSWSVTDLSSVAPDDTRYLSGVSVGADRIVVLGHGKPGHGQTKGETMTLVATPVR